MQYHKYAKGFFANFKRNLSRFICKAFGHRINEDPSMLSCNRCKLAYEECYYPKDYYRESGIIDKSIYDENGAYKQSLMITHEDDAEYISPKVFEKLRSFEDVRIDELLLVAGDRIVRNKQSQNK